MKNYNFYQNEDCPYFPCHDVDDIENFNCKWCFCPLYFSDNCPGIYEINDSGIKDCSECTIPHYADMTEIVGKYVDEKDWVEE